MNGVGNTQRIQAAYEEGRSQIISLEKSVSSLKKALDAANAVGDVQLISQTRSNLSGALASLGVTLGGASGIKLLGEAQTLCDHASTSKKSFEDPIGWAELVENRGLISLAMSNIDPDNAKEHLKKAIKNFDDALISYDRASSNFHCKKCQHHRTLAANALAALNPSE